MALLLWYKWIGKESPEVKIWSLMGMNCIFLCFRCEERRQSGNLLAYDPRACVHHAGLCSNRGSAFDCGMYAPESVICSRFCKANSIIEACFLFCGAVLSVFSYSSVKPGLLLHCLTKKKNVVENPVRINHKMMSLCFFLILLYLCIQYWMIEVEYFHVSYVVNLGIEYMA